MDNVVQFPDLDPDIVICGQCGNMLWMRLSDGTAICPVCDMVDGDDEDTDDSC